VPPTSPTVDTMFNTSYTGTASSITTASSLDITNPSKIRFRAGSGTSLRGTQKNGEWDVTVNFSTPMDAVYITTTNTTLTRGNRHFVDATSGAITVLVPNVAGLRIPGEIIVVTKVDTTTNPVYIVRNPAFPFAPGWGLVGPQADFVLTNADDTVILQSTFSGGSTGSYEWRLMQSTGCTLTIVNKSANYTAQAMQHVRVNTSGGNRTMTLPKGVDCLGRIVTFEKITSDANTVSFAAQGSDALHLPTGFSTLASQYATVTFRGTTDGASNYFWDVVAINVGVALPLNPLTDLTDGGIGNDFGLKGQSGALAATGGKIDNIDVANSIGFVGRFSADYDVGTGPDTIEDWVLIFYQSMLADPSLQSVDPTTNTGAAVLMFDKTRFANLNSPLWVEPGVVGGLYTTSLASPSPTGPALTGQDVLIDLSSGSVAIDLEEVLSSNDARYIRISVEAVSATTDVATLTPFSGQYIYPTSDFTSGGRIATFDIGVMQSVLLQSIYGSGIAGYRIVALWPELGIRNIDSATTTTPTLYGSSHNRIDATTASVTATLAPAQNWLGYKVSIVLEATALLHTVTVNITGGDTGGTFAGGTVLSTVGVPLVLIGVVDASGTYGWDILSIS